MTTLAPFLAAVRRTPLLDPVEEIALARATRSGDRGALARLVCSNLPFVLKLAKEYRDRGVPFEDLVAEGNLGLLEAAERFEPEHCTRFITYAMWWIRKRMLLALEMQPRMVRVPGGTWACRRKVGHDVPLQPREISLDDARGSSGRSLLDRLPDAGAPHAERDLVHEAAVGAVVAALPRLSPQERHVLRHRFGLDGDQPRTLRETGECLRVSRERVRQLEQQAIARLRRALTAQGRPHARYPRVRETGTAAAPRP